MIRLLALWIVFSCSVAEAAINKVKIDGMIDPITSEFIGKAIRQAEENRAEFLLLELSTPGGLGVSMQEIIQDILNSKVPVVCYVTPQGAHAASAGFFILLSSDIAAMAPGTNTGSAHPVFPFGMENKIMLQKVRNDALASLRSIVKQRKRNYEMAEKAVTESKSYTAQEALDGGLIDLIARDQRDLLEKLKGRQVTRFTGETQILEVRGQPIVTIEPTVREKVLSAVANPNLALVLGLLGLLGIYLEFTHPGLILPGVVGTIALILALVGFSLVPINLVGALLILVAIGLFVAEVKVQGFGLLGIAGVISMVLGMLFLVDTPYPEVRIGLGLAFGVAIPFALIFVFLLRLVIRAQKHRITTGEAGLIGLIGEARTEITPEGGKVFVYGEWWRATSRTPIPAGTRVRILEAHNLDLVVEPYLQNRTPAVSGESGESARQD
ncbi:MAG: nodulation protein NfeD [Acidobacteriota bacterium]